MLDRSSSKRRMLKPRSPPSLHGFHVSPVIYHRYCICADEYGVTQKTLNILILIPYIQHYSIQDIKLDTFLYYLYYDGCNLSQDFC